MSTFERINEIQSKIINRTELPLDLSRKILIHEGNFICTPITTTTATGAITSTEVNHHHQHGQNQNQHQHHPGKLGQSFDGHVILCADVLVIFQREGDQYNLILRIHEIPIDGAIGWQLFSPIADVSLLRLTKNKHHHHTQNKNSHCPDNSSLSSSSSFILSVPEDKYEFSWLFEAADEKDKLCWIKKIKDTQTLAWFPRTIEAIYHRFSIFIPRETIEKTVFGPIVSQEAILQEIIKTEQLSQMTDYLRNLQNRIDNQTDYHLDLQSKLLIHEGWLTWRTSKFEPKDVYVLLLSDVLIILTREDDQLVLKEHEGISPIWRLQRVLAVFPLKLIKGIALIWEGAFTAETRDQEETWIQKMRDLDAVFNVINDLWSVYQSHFLEIPRLRMERTFLSPITLKWPNVQALNGVGPYEKAKQHIAEIQKKLVNTSGLTIDLFGKPLVHEGNLTWLTSKGKRVTSRALLYNDMMVILEREGDQLFLRDHDLSPILHYPYTLRKHGQDNKAALYIMSTGQTKDYLYRFNVPSISERDEWIHKIRETLVERETLDRERKNIEMGRSLTASSETCDDESIDFEATSDSSGTPDDWVMLEDLALSCPDGKSILKEIEGKITGSNELRLDLSKKQLIHHGRCLLKVGQQRIDSYLILCSDVLIILKPIGDHFILDGYPFQSPILDLRGVRAESRIVETNFSIFYFEKEYFDLVAGSSNKKQTWLDKIQGTGKLAQMIAPLTKSYRSLHSKILRVQIERMLLDPIISESIEPISDYETGKVGKDRLNELHKLIINETNQEIDLRNKKLIYEGQLIWKMTKQECLDVYAVLCSDMMVLLVSHEDGGYLLKDHLDSPILSSPYLLKRSHGEDKSILCIGTSNDDAAEALYEFAVGRLCEKDDWIEKFDEIANHEIIQTSSE